MYPQTLSRVCGNCGADISSMRQDATVCRKAKCRKAAQRRRLAHYRRYRRAFVYVGRHDRAPVFASVGPFHRLSDADALYLIARKRLEAAGVQIDPRFGPEVFENKPKRQEVVAAARYLDPPACPACFDLFLRFGRGERCFECIGASSDEPSELAEVAGLDVFMVFSELAALFHDEPELDELERAA